MKNYLIILLSFLFLVSIAGVITLGVTLNSSNNQLADTKLQLSDTQSQLSDAQSQLSGAQSNSDSADNQISVLQNQLSSSQSQLSSTQAQLINFQTQFQSTQNKLTSVQLQLANLQTSSSPPVPKVLNQTAELQDIGFLGPGALECIVTVTIINNGGPGKVTVTATITGSNASQSGTSLFFDQGQQQNVTVIIPNALTNEKLTITAK